MKIFNIFFFAVFVITIACFSFFFFTPKEEKEFQLPHPSVITGGKEIKNGYSDTEVGTGWSTKENPKEATKEAINMALEGKNNKTPDFALLFATSGSDLESIFFEVKNLLGSKTKIYGGTTDFRAVMTDKGFVKANKNAYNYELKEGKFALAIMTISSKDIIFGVGSADLSAYPLPEDGAKKAVLDAIASCGKSPTELPNIVLIMPTRSAGAEEDVIKGIEKVVGGKSAIFGGTAGGPKWAVIGKDQLYTSGISVAVIYTDLPIGCVFEGGFDVTDNKSGTVTKVDGRNILEIDNRPALDVYNEWLNDDIENLHHKYYDNPRKIRDLLTMHPLYRRYVSNTGQASYLFSHCYPKDDTLKERYLATSTSHKVGEKLNLSHGTWETIMNRIDNLPRIAKFNAGIDINTRPIFGIGYVCGGFLGAIPETESEKMPILIGYANNEAPFIIPFTWGEQGHFTGIGNKHGGLLTSFIVVGTRER